MKNKLALGLVTSRKNKPGYLAIDYDGLKQKQVEEDSKKLIKKFKLKNCLLIKTQHGFHTHYFWNNKLKWKKIITIIKKSKADKDFKDFKDSTDFSRIRIKGKDLKVIKIIISQFHRKNKLGDFYFNLYQNMIK